MTRSWMSRITDRLMEQLARTDLAPSFRRRWIYRGQVLVFDFGHLGVNFGFDMTAMPDGSIALCLAQRGRLDAAFSVAPPGMRKQTVGTAADIDGITDLLLDRLRVVIADITRFRSTSAATDPGPVVGVLTLPLGRNYGGNLQAHALMQALRELGCAPLLINRRYAADAPDTADTAVQPLITDRIGLPASMPNAAFLERHALPISRPFHRSADLAQAIDGYRLHAVIAGSDQIWRPAYARGLLGDFFHAYLGPERRDIRRISYAASFGADDWDLDPDRIALMRRHAALLDAVSVREDRGIQLCEEHLGIQACHVLDPTMLLQPDHYRMLMGPRRADRPQRRLTVYMLNSSPAKAALIADICRRNDLTAAPPGQVDPARPDMADDRSVEGWLAAFDNAEAVFTDSFHGMVFAILFRKPFIAFGNPARGLSRFTSLLRALGLEDRLVLEPDSRSADLLARPIDWTAVEERLSRLRERSWRFLREALDLPVAAATETGIVPAAAPKLCTGCGICVRRAQGGLRMDWNDEGFLVPVRSGTARLPPATFEDCPFNPDPAPGRRDEDELAQVFLPRAPASHPLGGRFETCWIGHSIAHRAQASSGGIATYVFEQLLRRGEADWLYIVRDDGQGRYAYRVMQPGDDIGALSGTRYFPVTLAGLFEELATRPGRVAISGVGCFIRAMRLAQQTDPVLRARVVFMSGIICGGLKSRFYTDFLGASTGISGPFTNPRYRVKNPEGEASDYAFRATDAQGLERQVRMRRLGDMWGSGLFKNTACDSCTDLLTELADMSLGDAWIPEWNRDGMGNSVVVTRSPLARRIIEDGVIAGDLVMRNVPIETVIRSQSGAVNHKINAMRFRGLLRRRAGSSGEGSCRTRLDREVGAAEMIVQLLRERARRNSLRIWHAHPDLDRFNRRMRACRRLLAMATQARKSRPDEVLDLLVAMRHTRAPVAHAPDLAPLLPVIRWIRVRADRDRDAAAMFMAMLPADQRARLGAPTRQAVPEHA